MVTLTTSHLSIFDVFYWPIDKVSDAAAGVWNWATADVFKNVDSPTCENDAYSGAGTASDRWQWASSNGPRILWCIGTDGAGDFVKLASGYRNPITVTWNAGFSRRSFSTTGGGLARELSDAIERALLPKPTEGGIAILDRGEQITLQLNGGRSAYLRTDFDHFAQIVDISLAGFSYISAAAGAGRGDLSKVLGSDPGLRQQIVDGLQKGDCLASAANQPEGTRLSVDQGSEIASRLVAECFPDDVAAEVAKRLGASVTFWDRIVSTIGGFLNGLRDLVVKGVGGYLTGLWDMGAGSDRYEMRLDPITPPQQADTGQDQQQEQGQEQEQTQQQSGGEQQAPPLASHLLVR